MQKSTIILLSILFISFQAYSQEWREMIDEGANFYDIQEAANDYFDNLSDARKPGYKQFKRWEYFMEQRVYPSGELPNPGMAFKEHKRYYKNKPALRSSITPVWTSKGPSATPNLEGLGRINFITFHPSNDSLFFVGAPSGGLWKTTDGGGTFVVLNDTMASIGCSDLAIDPSNDSIMYLATGDRDGDDTYAIGVMKSFDGGYSWDTTGLNWNVNQTRTVNGLIINQLDPNVILAATSNGIYKTKDAGAKWVRVQAGNFKDIEYMPGDTSHVYASGAVFFRSRDGGETFNSVTVTGGTNRMEIAVTPANPSNVYIMASATNNGARGFYFSSDSGSTWTQRHGTSNPNLLGWAADGSDNSGQGWYDLACAVSPTDPDLVFVGGINMYKSTDGGDTWNINTHWAGQSVQKVHADCHQLHYHPNGTLYTGNDGGIYKTENDGSTWLNLSTTLVITQSYRIGISQHDYGVLLMGNQDNGTNLSDDTWQYRHVVGGDGMECIISHGSPLNMWGCSQNGNIQRSSDGGISFGPSTSGINEGGGWVTPYIQDPWLEDILYSGYNNIWKTTTFGSSWFKVNTSGFPSGGKTAQMAISKWWPDRVLASKSSRLYLSDDGGVTWSRIDNGTPGLTITYVAFDNKDLNGSTIWVTYSGYDLDEKVYKTTDLGVTWTNESEGLPNVPANCVLIDALGNGNGVYVGTDIGVFYKDDTISTFQPYGTGLPNVIVSEMEIQEDAEMIIAGTYGRGIWEIPLLSQGLNSLRTYGKQGDLELLISPNPNNGDFSVEWSGNSNDVSISILDLTGAKVFEYSGGSLLDEKRVSLSPSELNLMPGIYLVRLNSGRNQVAKKVVIQ